MYRKTYLEVDCEKLENNIKEIIKVYNDYNYYFGIVKANAYGMGIKVIKYLINGGINYLAVSSLEEALELRCLDKKIPVLVMEPISYEGILDASKNDITVTIDNREFIDKLNEDKVKIKFHLKVDSGMNRFGVKNREDANYIYEHSNDNVFMEGIFTHLSSGCGEGFNRQIEKFKEITKDIDLSKIKIVHLDRSLTLESHEKLEFENGVRLGVVMYGFNKPTYVPSRKRKIYNFLTGKKSKVSESKLNLDSVSTLKTNVIEIKTVKKGDVIGYSGMYNLTEDVKIGILPIGFADFTYLDKQEVTINNNTYKIIVINMDVSIILIDDNVKLYDEVILYNDNKDIKKISREKNVNSYKIMTSVTDRVPRVYKYKNDRYEIKYRSVMKK